MNAIELHNQAGSPVGVFYCTECKCVWRTNEEAERCCEPTKCQFCGKETERKYFHICKSCELANRVKKERERFEKAKKLTEAEWQGWVYLDGTGRDGYAESISDFWGDWESKNEESDPAPEYVWSCRKIHFVAANLSDITERISDNAYEDFDADDLDGLDELDAAIRKFNEVNKDVVSYEPDYGVAILLNRKAT